LDLHEMELQGGLLLVQHGKEGLVFLELGSCRSDPAMGHIEIRILLGVMVVEAVLHIEEQHLAWALKHAMIELVDLAGQLMGLVGHGMTYPQLAIVED
ncbi:hypothetical protein IFM61606_10871, partial [Aspergillus udagawae]